MNLSMETLTSMAPPDLPWPATWIGDGSGAAHAATLCRLHSVTEDKATF